MVTVPTVRLTQVATAAGAPVFGHVDITAATAIFGRDSLAEVSAAGSSTAATVVSASAAKASLAIPPTESGVSRTQCRMTLVPGRPPAGFPSPSPGEGSCHGSNARFRPFAPSQPGSSPLASRHAARQLAATIPSGEENNAAPPEASAAAASGAAPLSPPRACCVPASPHRPGNARVVLETLAAAKNPVVSTEG